MSNLLYNNNDLRNYSPKIYFQFYSHEITEALNTVDGEAINRAYKLLDDAYDFDWPVLLFGNGGSAGIVNHMMADLIKCVGHDCFEPVLAKSLCDNSQLLTCLANDYSYEEVFSKQIERWPDYKTLIIGVSSSGNSPNIVKAFEAARNKDFHSIALVGFDGGAVLKDKLADIIIHVKSNNYGIVEDCHSIILHTLIQKLRINNTKDVTQIRL